MARMLLLASCLFLLSACDAPFNTSSSSQTAGNPGNTTTQSPLVVPPVRGEAPLQPGESGTQYMPNGMPALQPPKGINYETLFDTRLKDDGKRFDRLESAVTDLRREFEAVKPAVVRLVAVEDDIQDLIQELEQLLQNEPPSAVAPRAVTPQRAVTAPPPNSVSAENATSAAIKPPVVLTPEKPKPVAPPPASNNADAQRLRFGEHRDKTRVVIDASKNIAYSVDLDNAEKLLVIDLPGASWGGQASWSSSKSPLVSSYTVQNIDDGGSRIIMVLKRSSSILKQTMIKPNADSRSHRLVIDLAK